MLYVGRRQLEAGQKRIRGGRQALAETTSGSRIVARNHNRRAAKTDQFQGQGTARRSSAENGNIGFQKIRPYETSGSAMGG